MPPSVPSEREVEAAPLLVPVPVPVQMSMVGSVVAAAPAAVGAWKSKRVLASVALVVVVVMAAMVAAAGRGRHGNANTKASAMKPANDYAPDNTDDALDGVDPMPENDVDADANADAEADSPERREAAPPPRESGEECPPYPLKGSPGLRGLVHFIHLPKAGGTSVQDTLREWAKTAHIPVVHRDNGGPDLRVAGLRNATRGVLIGHRGYGFARGAPRARFTLVALREPVARIISLFDYLRDQDRGLTPELKRLSRTWSRSSLDDVVASYNATWHADASALEPGGAASLSDRSLHRVLSAQTQYLCGYDCVMLMSDDPAERQASYRSSNAVRLSADEKLARALRNLEAVDAVAVLTRLDDLVPQMRTRLGWIPASFSSFPHDNAVKPVRKSEPTPATRALLAKFGSHDAKLYAKAVELADAKTSRALACLQRRGGGGGGGGGGGSAVASAGLGAVAAAARQADTGENVEPSDGGVRV